MYYGGRPTSHKAKLNRKLISALGRAWLRMDGFVSYTGGILITKSFPVSGKKLQVNAKGDITAKVYDVNGTEISSGSFSGDAISETIVEIDTIKDEKCFIEFDCRDGELFSFWFE